LDKGKFAIKAWHSDSPEIDQDGNESKWVTNGIRKLIALL
jgi:hypothetical protein